MKKLLFKIYTYFWARLPQPLPTYDVDHFNAYCTRLLGHYGIPDLAPYREAIANFIMHLSPNSARVRPSKLAATVKKAMANEVCYQYLQEQRTLRATQKPALSVANDGNSQNT